MTPKPPFDAQSVEVTAVKSGIVLTFQRRNGSGKARVLIDVHSAAHLVACVVGYLAGLIRLGRGEGGPQ